MRCEICGMKIRGEPVIEDIDGKKHYYCCKGCLDFTICTCDKQIKNLKKKNWHMEVR